MHEPQLERHAGCKRDRRPAAISIAMRAVLVVLMAAPHVPCAEALKLASISEDRGHLGVGLLRAVEVVRGRYERAWALVSASEPTAEDLDTALELLQENAKQWESLEPAVKLWTERDNEAPRHTSSTSAETKHTSSASSSGAADGSSNNGQQQQQQQQVERASGAPGASDTTSRIYEEAASLLAHNRAVLGQALARSGHTDRGIEELEAACPEILEYQQNAQGRRDSKSWLHCYANLAEMYKTQRRFEEASSLLARMPWLPSPQGTETAAAGGESAPPSEPHAEDGDDIPAVPLGTGHAADHGSPEDANGDRGVATEETALDTSTPHGEGEEELTAGEPGAAAVDSTPAVTPPSKGSGGGRSEAPPPRGAGAARVAGLNKAAAAASAVAAAESAAAAAAVETGAEAAARGAARAIVDRHAEAMRASMNELVGELAVTTATRPSAAQDWLDSRVVSAEEVLATVRSGLLAAATTSEQATGAAGDAAAADTVDDVPNMAVGANGHADILREASHYLSAIKGVAAQGWAYVDNELHRMERHPPPPVKPGFQTRREVIHTFRYLLVKARQYASENQSQTSRPAPGTSSQTGSGSGSASRWRRKERGRKGSASSKAPRHGSAARGKSSAGSGSESSSNPSDGILTLFIGAGIALLVAAFSSGRNGGQGRRREVVRQRTATRAAKTVGSYVEPPQRTAIAALLLHLWGNLKRSSLVVSSHATTTAGLARTVLLTAWASAFEGLRAARDSTRSRRAIGGGKPTTAPLKKTAQRSKKNGKKAAAAPARLLVREDTTMVTPPASPPSLAQSAAQRKGTTAAATAARGVVPPVQADRPEATGQSVAVLAAAKPIQTATKSASMSNNNTHVSSVRGPADAAAVDPVLPTASTVAAAAVAAQTATEKTAGVPFPDVMTAEQVQAMVEEDERAWEQARLSERLHSKSDAAAAAASAAATPQRGAAADEGVVDDTSGAGWSEVGGSGSRGGRTTNGGGGGGRGRVLSIRNVRAAAQAARTSSPGSDPATTTSASSSDSSDGCKDKIGHRYVIDGRSAEGRTTSRQGGRAVSGTSRTFAAPRARSKPTPGQSRGGGAAVRQPQHQHQPGRGSAQAKDTSPAKDSDQATSRAARTSYAPWAATRNTSAAPAGGGKPRNVSTGAPKNVPAAADTSSRTRGSSLSDARPPRQNLEREVSAKRGAGTEADRKSAEEDSPAPTAQPPAWTNTPSHPLGMQPKPAPLPPASEMPRPPPQHQQHWQRHQQREHHQHQHHFFHQQEPPLMPMASAPVQRHQDVNHHYPPLSLPPQPHHHLHPPPRPQQQQQHEVMMPQFLAPPDEGFPPPAAHMPIAAPPAVLYPTHPVVHAAALPSPGVSPGGGVAAVGDPHFHVRDGSNDSPGSAGVGFSPDAAVLAPLQAMMLPPPYEQQQPGRFSPITLPVVPMEDASGGGGGGGAGSPMYGQRHVPTSAGYAPSTSANGGGGDGGEAIETLLGALRWQVEYYFSADNLVTDSYLRGLMDREGFVAVSKIMVFNRVRSMTSDFSLLTEAMRRSSELEIMEQDHIGETCVRTRHSPLHWTQEQLPPAKVPSSVPQGHLHHEVEEHYEEEEEEEEEKHHITFGNVAEVIGRDEPAVSVEPERAESRE